MKCVKWLVRMAILFIMLLPVKLRAQSHEAQQLLLNVEKLAQLKQILQNMYDGYKILHKGYTAIKDISEGNFSIHRTFLDGLLAVSPVVRKYKRIGDIVAYQLRIIKEYKSAYRQFKEDKNFTSEELAYIGRVYGRLTVLSLQNLDELATVLTAGKLRMSDDERIEAIDRIYSGMEDQLTFLRHFNNTAKMLSLARSKEQEEVDVFRKLSGID